MLRLRTAVATLLLAGLLVSCGQPGPEGPLVIATGGSGGVYYAYGHGLADVVAAEFPAMTPRVLSTAASLQNLRMVAAGQADIAFTLADSAALAGDGEEPFDEPLPIRALARLYDNYVHLVVPAESGVETVDDLRGRVVSTGDAGSGTDLIATRLLAVAGVDPDVDLTRRRLGVDDSAAALRAGAVDAFFFSSGLPTGAIERLAADRRVRLVGLAEHVGGLRERYGELYSERAIPASVYGVEVVDTVGVPNYLVVHEDMDDELAYRLTRALFGGREVLVRAHPEARRLNLRGAFATYPVPLHPGATRYYREARSS